MHTAVRTSPLRRRAVLAALAGASLAVSHRGAQAQVSDINDAINKAGRQRMLSQRMAKAWLAIGLDIEVARAQRILGDSMALFDRVFEYLDMPVDIQPGTRTLERPEGDVRFDDVWFRYSDDQWTLARIRHWRS